MSHSPAPWKFVASIYDDDDMLSTHKEVPYDYHSGNFCYNPSIIDAEGNEVVGCDEYYVFSTPENVRLMVHAPELLEALKALVDMPDERSINDVSDEEIDLWMRAKAAIAKAEGEQL